MTVYDLPPINATLNGISTLFILLGLVFIFRRQQRAHIACMTVALVSSAAFLACYLAYHAAIRGHSVRFTHEGAVKYVYYFILLTHVVLAVVNLPMILITVMAAVRGQFDKHRRWARRTAPIWLYVSVTGVLVYLMVYRWYPSADLAARAAEVTTFGPK